jgi:hypothetical protein
MPIQPATTDVPGGAPPLSFPLALRPQKDPARPRPPVIPRPAEGGEALPEALFPHPR